MVSFCLAQRFIGEAYHRRDAQYKHSKLAQQPPNVARDVHIKNSMDLDLTQ